MKFKDLFIFLEQEDEFQDPDWLDDLDGEDDILNPPEPNMDDDEIPDDEDPDQPQEPDQERPEKPKKLSAKQQIKQKWLSERPGLSDMEMEEAIAFFNERRNGLRPYHAYGYVDPNTNRHWVNNPEITTLVERFPEMTNVLGNPSTLTDLKNWPWAVMDFYMEIITTESRIQQEDNLVPNITLSIQEQLEIARRRWTKPENKIIEENGTIVYRVESQQESIALGALQRATRSLRKKERRDRGALYWCITVPLDHVPDEMGDTNRGNLWTTYRPHLAPYFIWDQNRTDDDPLYIGVIQVAQSGHHDGPYVFVDLENNTDKRQQWTDIIRRYPQLDGKQNLFQHFGTTRKERVAVSIRNITMTPGDRNYFGIAPKALQYEYVDSGRYVNNVRAFLTMNEQTRKHYIDLTTKENNDLQKRFVCDDPANPYGILEAIRLDKVKENLYKFLDEAVLKYRLQIPDGINAIKKIILGKNFDRWLSDDERGITLVRKRQEGGTRRVGTALNDTMGKPFGVVNTNDGEVERHAEYIAQVPRTFIEPVMGPDGKMRAGNTYILQKFSQRTGDGNVDQSEGFYMWFTQSAVSKNTDGTVPDDYLKGKYMDLDEAEEMIRQKLGTQEIVQLTKPVRRNR